MYKVPHKFKIKGKQITQQLLCILYAFSNSLVYTVTGAFNLRFSYVKYSILKIVSLECLL